MQEDIFLPRNCRERVPQGPYSRQSNWRDDGDGVGESDILDFCANEAVVAHRFHTVGDGDGSKAGATLESAVTNYLDRGGDGEGGYGGGTERVHAERNYGLGEGDGGEVRIAARTFEEGEVADGGYGVFDVIVSNGGGDHDVAGVLGHRVALFILDSDGVGGVLPETASVEIFS